MKFVTVYESITGFRCMLIDGDEGKKVSDAAYRTEREAEVAARAWAKLESCTFLSDQSPWRAAERSEHFGR